jgi:hypothetical protein
VRPAGIEPAEGSRQSPSTAADERPRASEPGREAWERAARRHLRWRFQQDRFEALELEEETFLTVRHVQRLLRAVGAPRKGEKAAREALRWWQEIGIFADTGKVKKPRVSASRLAAGERFGRGTQPEGGRDAQPSVHHAYWWRVYRVVPIARVLRARRRLCSAYGILADLPQHEASLSAFLACQGLIYRRKRPSEFSKGSVQWVFAHTGPP